MSTPVALTTIKSLLVETAEIEAFSGNDLSGYKVLADNGYKPAQKIAPIAHGYKPIDDDHVKKMFQNLGNDVKKETLENIKRWEGQRTINSQRAAQLVGSSYSQDERRELFTTIRLNPNNNRPTQIGIVQEKLSDYQELIPPKSASLIADAIKTELFQSIYIWNPLQYEYPIEAINYTPEVATNTKLLDDPVAVGKIGSTYYFICAWDEDLYIEGGQLWLR